MSVEIWIATWKGKRQGSVDTYYMKGNYYSYDGKNWIEDNDPKEQRKHLEKHVLNGVFIKVGFKSYSNACV